MQNVEENYKLVMLIAYHSSHQACDDHRTCNQCCGNKKQGNESFSRYHRATISLVKREDI